MIITPITPIQNHREREKGVLVYPVYSRRSGGLSVGINLFPDQKSCPFDCPYCEVFPFSTKTVFSPQQMEDDLRSVITDTQERNIPIKDICFSGNGEPSLSPDFPKALELTGRIRGELVPSAKLVLITNGAGLLDQKIFSLLVETAAPSNEGEGNLALDIWLKLDAGTPQWYQMINRTEILHDRLIAKIKEFAALAPLTIQTMLCSVEGKAPPLDEAQAWETLLLELAVIAANGTGKIRKIQIYGKARPSPDDPKAQELPVATLEERAASLKQALGGSSQIPIEVFP
jgi:histidinol dehydrogenase